ncbi:MAG: hypothetical protein E7222_14875 [Clostridiales bacterium]|uniref:hypothetical protein n=1 Tax=Aminipila sp. TaxID=2060095 RepID=UPI001DC1F026|nr:hypothetical protein [Aminipila sp.]MBE6035961.1 hypothetical protein [Clostridiales bacterium]
MLIRLKKVISLLAGVIFLLGIAVLILPLVKEKWHGSLPVMGGEVHSLAADSFTAIGNESQSQDDNQRFQRPSNQLVPKNKFSFKDFEKDNDKPPLITAVFSNPEDSVRAYFGILRDASNMKGYLGGCGTIGNSLQPYSYAYELYSSDTRKQMSLSDFVDSFTGIGHINLLKLYPAYSPSGTPDNLKYYMFEIETITGPSEKDKKSYKRGGSYFAYYYGLITTEYNTNDGWKIKSIDYLPEDFLCAPYHGWAYAADYVVPIVYHDWYQLVDTVDSVEQNEDMINVLASGAAGQYRFDFVRLTNGYDILLHEYVWKNNQWEEINILQEKDQNLKLSPLNPNLQ